MKWCDNYRLKQINKRRAEQLIRSMKAMSYGVVRADNSQSLENAKFSRGVNYVVSNHRSVATQ